MAVDRQQDKDLLEVLKTAAGRRFAMELIFERAKMDEGTFSPPHEMAFREGRRSVGVELAKRIMFLDPDSYKVILRERVDSTEVKRNG